jgi:two-component system, chemotaxis family, sensor kinase CheA
MTHRHDGSGATGAAPPEAVAAVLERMSEELAFVSPGSNEGLLPLNALLMDLERLPGLCGERVAALAIARRWLDAVLDGEGLFSATDIQNLQTWVHWFFDDLIAEETGRPAMALPVQWRQPPTSGFSPPSVAGHEPAIEVTASAAEVVATEVPSFRLRLPDDIELLREFHSESLELLRGIEQSVLALEDGTATPETVHSIFRAFHTFKGSAGFLQLDALRDFAHELESLLDEVRSGRLALGPVVIEAILGGADVLAASIATVGAQVGGALAVGPIPLPGATVLATVQRALRGESAPVVVVAQPPREVSPPILAAASDHAEAFVRVDAGKLDALVNLVGELVITQSYVLGAQETPSNQNLELGYALRKLTRITRELQHATLSMRMVPIASLFRRMGRLVRDLSASLGKQARLLTHGEDTELDRHLVEQMADPLVHMIRNALDHGVETPEMRIAAGKDPVATIRLGASHSHGGVRIEISDDGRGIDTRAVLARALEKQLIRAETDLSEHDILALIFLPGFTTASAVTEVSGRGVGMDVVKGHIDALRGHIDITTDPGKGTTFAVRLPLTLSQIDGFLVGVAGERYILPSASVRECFQVGEGSIASVHEHSELVDVRGQPLPLLRLDHCLGLRERGHSPGTGIIVVLETSVGARALWVDEVLGKQEVIIKSLGSTFASQNLVGGGAILADGRVALILEAESLARLPAGSRRPSQRDVA